LQFGWFAIEMEVVALVDAVARLFEAQVDSIDFCMEPNTKVAVHEL
jgi:hypothetical protein